MSLYFDSDTATANAQVRSLSETIRLDSRTKLLNPKWYEGMLNSGYEGVREVAKRLTSPWVGAPPAALSTTSCTRKPTTPSSTIPRCASA